MTEHDLVKRIERLEMRVQKLDRLMWKLFQVTTKLLVALKPFFHADEQN